MSGRHRRWPDRQISACNQEMSQHFSCEKSFRWLQWWHNKIDRNSQTNYKTICQNCQRGTSKNTCTARQNCAVRLTSEYTTRWVNNTPSQSDSYSPTQSSRHRVSHDPGRTIVWWFNWLADNNAESDKKSEAHVWLFEQLKVCWTPESNWADLPTWLKTEIETIWISQLVPHYWNHTQRKTGIHIDIGGRCSGKTVNTKSVEQLLICSKECYWVPTMLHLIHTHSYSDINQQSIIGHVQWELIIIIRHT